MAKNVGDTLRDSVAQVLREAAEGTTRPEPRRTGRLSGMRGVAVGAGLAALVPVAARAARGPLKRKLAKGAVKHVAKKPARAVRDLSSKG